MFALSRGILISRVCSNISTYNGGIYFYTSQKYVALQYVTLMFSSDSYQQRILEICTQNHVVYFTLYKCRVYHCNVLVIKINKSTLIKDV